MRQRIAMPEAAAETVSLVIPAHNEAENLRRTLPQFRAWQSPAFTEIIIVDDGSRDDTGECVRRSAAEDPRVKLIALPRNTGKGAALKAGILAAASDVIFYTDADLIYDLGALPEWIAHLRRAEVVNGNRRLPDSIFQVPTRLFPYVVKRARLGQLFNWMVRRILPIDTTDTQSGCKLFRREVAHRLAAVAVENHFAFDAELFAVAHGFGFRVVDVPVQLDYRNEISRVRLLRDGWRMLRAVFAIRRRLRHGAIPFAERVIINADDYGFSERVSEGILAAHANGVVNSVSVFANMPAAAVAARRLQEFPGLRVGAHLNGTAGRPLTAGAGALTNRSGEFSRQRFCLGYLFRRRRTLAALAAEWEAQIAQLAAWGLHLRHLDSHHHLHLLPGVGAIAIALARKAGIPRIRASHDPRFLRSPRTWILYWLGRGFARRARSQGLIVADHFRGAGLMAATDKEQAFAKILRHLPIGVTEIYCHPGYTDATLPDSYREGRVAELQALTAPRIRAAFAAKPLEFDIRISNCRTV